MQPEVRPSKRHLIHRQVTRTEPSMVQAERNCMTYLSLS